MGQGTVQTLMSAVTTDNSSCSAVLPVGDWIAMDQGNDVGSQQVSGTERWWCPPPPRCRELVLLPLPQVCGVALPVQGGGVAPFVIGRWCCSLCHREVVLLPLS